MLGREVDSSPRVRHVTFTSYARCIYVGDLNVMTNWASELPATLPLLPAPSMQFVYLGPRFCLQLPLHQRLAAPQLLFG